jgi:hypothetical protein
MKKNFISRKYSYEQKLDDLKIINDKIQEKLFEFNIPNHKKCKKFKRNK